MRVVHVSKGAFVHYLISLQRPSDEPTIDYRSVREFGATGERHAVSRSTTWWGLGLHYSDHGDARVLHTRGRNAEVVITSPRSSTRFARNNVLLLHGKQFSCNESGGVRRWSPESSEMSRRRLIVEMQASSPSSISRFPTHLSCVPPLHNDSSSMGSLVRLSWTASFSFTGAQDHCGCSK